MPALQAVKRRFGRFYPPFLGHESREEICMKKSRTFAVAGALFALATWAPLPGAFAAEECCEEGAASTRVAIRQLKIDQVRAIAARKQQGVLIDSRSPDQYKAGHIPRAISVPVSDGMAKGLPKDKSTLLVFYCGAERCGLSTTAAEKAVKMGYKKVAVYKGGWSGWTQTASR